MEYQEFIRKVEAAGQQADGRHQDVFHQRGDDPSEGGADNDADRQVDRISLDRELFEFFKHTQVFLGSHDVHKLFWDDDDLADGLSADRVLHFLVCTCGRFELGVRGIERDRDPVAQLSVHLEDDLDLVFDQESFVVFGPAFVR